MDQLFPRKHHLYFNKIAIIIIIALHSLVYWSCREKSATPIANGVYLSENEHDFGIVQDSINEVQSQFFLINNTNDTCEILNVEKSCGCTNINIEDKIIAPHDSVSLIVILDIGSNYSFVERDISIYTNLQEDPLTLYLRAARKVPQIIIKKVFPFKLSENFKMSSNYALLGYVQHGIDKDFSINILNVSESTKHLSLASHLPDGFDVILPTEIAPQEITRIVFSCNLNNNIWGEVSFDCYLKDDDGITQPIRIYAVAVEQFNRKKKTHPRINVPVLNYSSRVLYNKGQVVFKLQNVGDDTLHIRSIKSSEESIGISIKNKSCPPNSSSEIIVRRKNDFQMNDDIVISIITDDIIEPFKQLRIIK